MNKRLLKQDIAKLSQDHELAQTQLEDKENQLKELKASLEKHNTESATSIEEKNNQIKELSETIKSLKLN